MSRSVKAITISRNKKFKSANMLQARRLAINVDISDEIKIGQLTVFDEYKIEKVSLKISPAGHKAVVAGEYTVAYIEFFTSIDRTGFSELGIAETALTIEKVRTYQSFKSINWPVNGDSASKMYVNIGQSDIVNKSKYYDTKGKAVVPELVAGVCLPGNATANTTFDFNVEIDAQVRYRGVRYDNRAVNAQ